MDAAVKLCVLRGVGGRPHHLTSDFAGLVKHQKTRQMGELSLLKLTTVVWLMVGLFKAQGLVLGPVPFKSRKTAFANFQTARCAYV